MKGRWRSFLWFAAFALVVPAWMGFAQPHQGLSPGPGAQAAAANAPDQPVPFSHKKHAGELAMSCEFCHAPSRSGETLSIPSASKCMSCHQTVAADTPGIQKLASFAHNNEPVPWVRVYQLPSFVTFSHKVHLDRGNTCQECHGQVAQRDQLFQEVGISMQACINCHQAKKARTECDTCHEPQQ
jgi:hypothetical protein